MPASWEIGHPLDVFIYRDSEDRPVATTKTPKAMPGTFARLKCVAVTGVGAFLDWGLAKDLLVPFREQKSRMEPSKSYLVHVHVDEVSGRIIASTRISRFLDQSRGNYAPGDAVELVVFGKTPLGYKAIINGTHSGLIFAESVFQELQPGERVSGFISRVREDGKIDLSLHAPGRDKVDTLEQRILSELKARGGFWAIGDHSPADEIHDELGVSKRTFKQSLGALLKRRAILIEEKGIRIAP
jgi:predicted RNA-binding protein (virulence factor B family)